MTHVRARDLGIPFDGEPGAWNAITDVPGVEVGYRTLGEGWPTLMLHGFLASAETNWFLPGIAAAVAATGRRVIAPDLRGHGRSDAPTDPAAWPRDGLAMDPEALIAHALKLARR